MSTLIDQLGKLKPQEMLSLVKQLEKRWGVSSSPAPVIRQEPTPPVVVVPEEDKLYKVKLISFGDKKMSTIKTLRGMNKTLSLLEAKSLVESAPSILLSDLTEESAQQAKKELEEAGATIELV